VKRIAVRITLRFLLTTSYLLFDRTVMPAGFFEPSEIVAEGAYFRRGASRKPSCPLAALVVAGALAIGGTAAAQVTIQEDTSITDQLRTCREYADRHRWEWQEACVYSDAGISGSSIEGRDGLQAVLTASASRPRPFDVLLVDDSSRVARDLPDALRVLQRLTFAGVRVIYISQGIDSASEQAETLAAVHGLVDSLYLRELGQKTKRGLRGQLERGFAAGARTYGYRTVPVPDANRPADPVGFRPQIDESEAASIQAVFQWYANGISIPNIITRLATEGYPAPRGGKWRVGAVQRILRNERYRGQLIWGRTQQTRRPGSRSRISLELPREPWHMHDRPELRIISDELWDRVQARRQMFDALLNKQRRANNALISGRNAKLYSSALFSGFMIGVCGKAIKVVNSRPYKGRRYRYYGCAHAYRNGSTGCTNRLTIRVEAADRELLVGLQAELLRPGTVNYITDRLASALNALIDQRPNQREAIERAKAAAAQKLGNPVAAVEAGLGTTTIAEAIKTREKELRALESQRAALDEPLEQRLAVVPTWVRRQLEDAAGLLAEVPERAKHEFIRLGVSFVLHPKHEEGRPSFLRAVGSGDFEHLAFGSHPAFPATDASRPQPIHR
jgi:site-specific DNA recombinase